MLMSLAAVLVLLAVGFYTLSVGATGRAGAGEGSALSGRTRALVLLLSAGSLGGAYLLYQKPLETASEPSEAAVTASNPPESRSSLAAESAGSAPQPAQAAAPAAEKAETPTTPSSAPAAEESLSSAALALETAGQSAKSVSEPEPAVERRVVEPAPVLQPEKPVAPATAPVHHARRTQPQQSRAAVPSLKPHKPVMLHVQNTLGPTQARERLTLSIEGRPVADLAVDSRRPGVEVSVPLPRGGLLHYRLEGASDDGGATTLVGEGCIRVQDDAHFDVRRRQGSQKVFLEASAGSAG